MYAEIFFITNNLDKIRIIVNSICQSSVFDLWTIYSCLKGPLTAFLVSGSFGSPRSLNVAVFGKNFAILIQDLNIGRCSINRALKGTWTTSFP